MTLHTKLVSLRKQNGFTQLDLAERLNVSRQAVSRWESGVAVPSIDKLKALSNLYGVSLDYLLNDDIDDSCKKAQEQKPEKQEQKSNELREKNKKRIIICTCVLILIISIAIIMGIRKAKEPEEEQIVPIEEMDTAIEDDYTEGTFSFN